jgi:hypothetical protein
MYKEWNAMHVGIIPFIVGLIYKSKWYKLIKNTDTTKPLVYPGALLLACAYKARIVQCFQRTGMECGANTWNFSVVSISEILLYFLPPSAPFATPLISRGKTL